MDTHWKLQYDSLIHKGLDPEVCTALVKIFKTGVFLPKELDENAVSELKLRRPFAAVRALAELARNQYLHKCISISNLLCNMLKDRYLTASQMDDIEKRRELALAAVDAKDFAIESASTSTTDGLIPSNAVDGDSKTELADSDCGGKVPVEPTSIPMGGSSPSVLSAVGDSSNPPAPSSEEEKASVDMAVDGDSKTELADSDCDGKVSVEPTSIPMGGSSPSVLSAVNDSSEPPAPSSEEEKVSVDVPNEDTIMNLSEIKPPSSVSSFIKLMSIEDSSSEKKDHEKKSPPRKKPKKEPYDGLYTRKPPHSDVGSGRGSCKRRR